MKTLKNLYLLASAMLVTSASFAQGIPAAAPDARTRPSVGADPGANAYGITLDRGYRTNESRVMQLGDRQYANVDQTGFSGNQADIIQNRAGDADDDQMNAYQKQIGSGTHGVNQAWVEQKGDHAFSNQYQNGSGNIATTLQGDQDYDYATQDQTGYSNKARIDQNAGDSGTGYNYARQSQTGLGGAVGHNNFARTEQTGATGAGWSVTTQAGTNNTAIVSQH